MLCTLRAWTNSAIIIYIIFTKNTATLLTISLPDAVNTAAESARCRVDETTVLLLLKGASGMMKSVQCAVSSGTEKESNYMSFRQIM